jgi:hypothetical protein
MWRGTTRFDHLSGQTAVVAALDSIRVILSKCERWDKQGRE